MPISLRPAANIVINYHSLAQYTWVYSDKECHDAGMMHGASRSQERTTAPEGAVDRMFLLAKSECCNDFAVAVDFVLLQIRQKILPLCYEHDKTTT